MNARQLTLLLAMGIAAFDAMGAPYRWQPMDWVVKGEYDNQGILGYEWGGTLTDDNKSVAGAGFSFVGYREDGNFYIKQLDHKTTVMPVDEAPWVIAYYGEVLSHETFDAATRIALTDWYDDQTGGGTLISTPDDFYLGFQIFEREGDGYKTADSRYWYGWMRAYIDDDMMLHVVDSDANGSFSGGGIVVGEHWLAEPEPASGLLAALGLAAVLLRRRRDDQQKLGKDGVE